jgi:hypothetical protein
MRIWDPGYGIFDTRSGMEKNSDPESATLVYMFLGIAV